LAHYEGIKVGFLLDEESLPPAPTSYNILAGDSRNFTAVWADPNANIETASMYVGSAGSGASFSVVSLNSKSLTDSYLIDKKGDLNEFLDSEDITDINVGA
jgi:hypothetical protein